MTNTQPFLIPSLFRGDGYRLPIQQVAVQSLKDQGALDPGVSARLYAKSGRKPDPYMSAIQGLSSQEIAFTRPSAFAQYGTGKKKKKNGKKRPAKQGLRQKKQISTKDAVKMLKKLLSLKL